MWCLLLTSLPCMDNNSLAKQARGIGWNTFNYCRASLRGGCRYSANKEMLDHHNTMAVTLERLQMANLLPYWVTKPILSVAFMSCNFTVNINSAGSELLTIMWFRHDNVLVMLSFLFVSNWIDYYYSISIYIFSLTLLEPRGILRIYWAFIDWSSNYILNYT